MRKILITNDDGITADGIIRLAQAAKRFGAVWVVAPDGQRSAMSHRITLREPIDVYPADFPVEGVKAYRTTGTPADCVRFGLLNLVEGSADVVLSGINYGYNIGSDIQYSATVGAALEAAHVGVQAIALSEGMGPHPVTDRYLEAMLEEYLDRPTPGNVIRNINFPECSMEEFRGILTDRRVAVNSFFVDSYPAEALPDGGMRLRVHGDLQTESEEGTDFRAVSEHYISIGTVQNLKEA